MLRILLVIVALSAGAGAAWMAVSLRGQPTTIVGQKPAPTQDVLVASTDVVQGQALTQENMRWQSWPESAVNPTYIKRSAQPDALEQMVGSLVRSRIVAGEPIGESKLASRNSGFLAALLPSGKRAVAVRISAENTAGGFILPNDRVDVLHTIEGENQKERVSRVILGNVIVLAVDQMVDEGNKDKKARAAVIGKTATLELDSDQAEILATAQAKGIISFALRSAADRDEPSSTLNRQISQTVLVRGGRRTIEMAPVQTRSPSTLAGNCPHSWQAVRDGAICGHHTADQRAGGKGS